MAIILFAICGMRAKEVGGSIRSPPVFMILFYSDTCAGQNKNSHVAAMLLCVIQARLNLIINQKFLVPGHTHMKRDLIHALIERRKKNCNKELHIPRYWFNLVRNCIKKENKIDVKVMYNSMFLDFAKLYKGPLQLRKFVVLGTKFLWQNVKWFQYSK